MQISKRKLVPTTYAIARLAKHAVWNFRTWHERPLSLHSITPCSLQLIPGGWFGMQDNFFISAILHRSSFAAREGRIWFLRWVKGSVFLSLIASEDQPSNGLQ
jgi:hypothetical protein|mmetsp:Transcript_37561/g.60195  ORF Transcript_37561/g.60195 Transcript_37561/m.60195 type:complete len:103 (+) Transcript_37561:2607-2915(+)